MISNYRSTQNITQAFSAQRPYATPYKKRTRFIDTVAADDGTDDGILSVVENPDCSSADLPCNVETPDGKRVIEIPVFDSMTKFMMSPQGMNQRLPLYTYLNEQLRKGRLSRIVGFPVLNRVINRAACEFTGFSYWEITRYEFITDISVKLTLESYDGIHEWNGVLVCFCGFSHQFYLFFMENHADRAAHGLMMPATDTRNRIQALLSRVKNYRHDGELFEFVGMTVSTQLDMPHFRMRARMIQLGYPQAKGILHYVEQRRIRPFAFDLDSLYAEELTFVITPAKIKKLCDESDAFRKVVNSRRFVYAEGHMVFNDPRFVEVQGGIYKLTNYAIANVDVCCLRFVNIYVQKNLGQYVLGRMYMDAEYVERTLFYLNDLLKNPDMNDFRAKKAYKEEQCKDCRGASYGREVFPESTERPQEI